MGGAALVLACDRVWRDLRLLPRYVCADVVGTCPAGWAHCAGGGHSGFDNFYSPPVGRRGLMLVAGLLRGRWVGVGWGLGEGGQDGACRFELAVVAGLDVGVAVEGEEKKIAGLAVSLGVCREPDLVVDADVGELEAGVLVDADDETATELEVVEEVGFKVLDRFVFFVDVEGSGEDLEGGFAGVVGLDVGVSGVVDEDGGASVNLLAARV